MLSPLPGRVDHRLKPGEVRALGSTLPPRPGIGHGESIDGAGIGGVPGGAVRRPARLAEVIDPGVWEQREAVLRREGHRELPEVEPEPREKTASA